jgi:hypothetical protein
MNNPKILNELYRIFRAHLFSIVLHLYNNETLMMGMLRQESGENWTTKQISDLAKNNKIDWPKGTNDPTPYDKYRKNMNNVLYKILQKK